MSIQLNVNHHKNRVKKKKQQLWIIDSSATLSLFNEILTDMLYNKKKQKKKTFSHQDEIS